MKILQINCVYNTGSTGKIMCDIRTELEKNNIDSVICYGRGAKVADKNVYKVSSELYSKMNNLASRLTGLMYGGCLFSTNKLISIIKKEKPDIVHVHCINNYFVNIYRLISWLNKNKIKTVVTNHAEFFYTANCSHAYDCDQWKVGCVKCPRRKMATKSVLFDRTKASYKKMKKAFEGFENVRIVSVSPWVMERARQSAILKELKHFVVLNGLDTSVFHIYENDDLREKYSKGEKIIFHATAHFSGEKNHSKGGYYIIELAKKMPEVTFVVAGPHDENISVPKNVVLLGRVSNQEELARHYSMADLTVVPSKRETFSMITAESLCCGTPVVGFMAGGPESITIDKYSLFVEYGNLEELENATRELLNKELSKEEISKEATVKYDKKRMAYGYMEIYDEVANGRNKN